MANIRAGYLIENVTNKKAIVSYYVDGHSYVFVLRPMQSRVISAMADDIIAQDDVGEQSPIRVFELMEEPRRQPEAKEYI